MYRKLSVAVALAGLLVAAPAFAQQPAATQPATKQAAPAAKQPAAPTAPAAKKQEAPKATAMARTAKPKATPRHRFSRADVKAAQEGLAKAGFYKGKTTGVWNSETTRALRAWQKANNEKVTGRLTEDELAKLKPQPQG